MSRFASGVGLIPEQNWELPDLAASPFGTDPTLASIGFVNGGAAGSASPLTWSAASFVRLAGDLAAGRNVVLPAATHSRYVAHTQGTTTLTVTSPADNSSVDRLAGHGHRHDRAGEHRLRRRDEHRRELGDHGRLDDRGADRLVQHRRRGHRRHERAQRRRRQPDRRDGAREAHGRSSTSCPGTLLLDVADPNGDDNGPGNYAYPTSANFHPGAFDIQQFQVYDSGADVTFRLQTRDLSETFGSPLGAQLVDVYVHVPGAATDLDRRGAPAAQLHDRAGVRVEPADPGAGLRPALRRRERRRRSGRSRSRANPISRFITFSVPKASLGTPGPGWGFTVVLTGQDGFSPDQARGFAPTPQEFQFGVCATASADPHCTFDPALVPKAIDVITPPGVPQSTSSTTRSARSC